MSSLIAALNSIPNRLGRLTYSGNYSPELDGLRFFAIAYVLLGHLAERTTRYLGIVRPLTPDDEFRFRFVPSPTVGVLLFFTISGFILASQFSRQKSRGKRFELPTYFLRRVTRIVPPYVLILLSTYVVLMMYPAALSMSVYGMKGPQSLTESLVVSLLYLHCLVYGTMPRIFPPGWTLEIEVHFYVIAPLLFLAYFGIRDTARRVRRGGLIMLACLAFVLAGQFLFGQEDRYYFTLPAFFVYFWLGVWIADLKESGLLQGRIGPRLADVLGFAGLLLLGLPDAAITTDGAFWITALVGYQRLLGITLMFAGAMHGAAFRRLCSLRWISFLGGACYSIYLCHLQVMQVLTPVIGRLSPSDSVFAAMAKGALVEIPVVFAVGIAFYVVVERPCMDPAWPAKLRRSLALSRA